MKTYSSTTPAPSSIHHLRKGFFALLFLFLLAPCFAGLYAQTDEITVTQTFTFQWDPSTGGLSHGSRIEVSCNGGPNKSITEAQYNKKYHSEITDANSRGKLDTELDPDLKFVPKRNIQCVQVTLRITYTYTGKC